MSSGNYNKSSRSVHEERKQLFSDVLGLDYMQGPTRTFNINDKFSVITDSLIDKVLECDDRRLSLKDLTSSKPDYISALVDLHLIAEFYLELKSGTPTRSTPKKASIFLSFEDLTSYPRKYDGPLAEYFGCEKKFCLVGQDNEGKKYIRLTEAGEKALSYIWDCVDLRASSDVEIPFSKIEDMNRELIIENDGTGILVNTDEQPPSILIQNTAGSAGLTKEYAAPDGSVLGYRRAIKNKE